MGRPLYEIEVVDLDDGFASGYELRLHDGQNGMIVLSESYMTERGAIRQALERISVIRHKLVGMLVSEGGVVPRQPTPARPTRRRSRRSRAERPAAAR